ncbi:retrovirus-related pol polyprotein from transposon TNT 1-94 [Tanacetum coccineum]
MNSLMDNASINVHECKKCLKLETKLLNKNDFIEKENYDNLFRSFTTLKKHCISLEVDTQLNHETFQRDNSVSNQSAPSFDQYFELNELKAQSQEKDTIIKKLKERIKSLSGKVNEDKIKKDLEEIETINIELDHRSAEISDLNASLKEKVLVITGLKDYLRKLKGKALVDNAITKHTIDPEMLKIDVEPITPKLLNKKTAHSAYIKHTQEEAAVLGDLVEHVKTNYPLDLSLESACRYTKRIQELLTNISKTCPIINNSGEKLVVVTPKNKDKRVRFTEPVISSRNTNTKTAYSSDLVFNKPMLSSTGVKSSTSASGSQPSGNTKKDKIQRTPSSTQKNKHSKLNANSELLCVKCNGCMISDNHDLCVLDFINDVNARAKSKSVKKCSKRKVWKPTRKVVQIVLWYLDSGCSKHMTEDSSQLTNFVNKFFGTVKFGNDHVAKILGYGDYQIGNVTISRVYYVEGLGHNLFSVGQFCDSNLEVAFRQHTYFIRNLEGVDLLTGSRGNNLYTLSLRDMMASSPISRHGLVRGLPKLKFEKDHLYSACAMGKSKKKPYKPKFEDTNQEILYLLHMDLCGPMRVTSVNRKKYILVIVDDYSRFTWVKCLRSKVEAPDFIIKFLKMIQVPVRKIRIYNGTEFVNQTLREYYEKVGISHETSVAHSPQQNGFVERRNRMLIEAARTMLIYAKAPLFLWAEAVSTACYTQNCSIIRLRHGKTSYELLHVKLPDLSFFHVFGALYYLMNNSENLGKLQPKADIDFDELTTMAFEHSSLGFALHEMTPTTISSGLVPNPPPLTPFVSPSRTDWDILFQPLFDELLTPPASVDRTAPEVIAPIAEVVASEPATSTGSPSSTTVDQDAPSPSNSQTTPKTQSPVISNDVEEDNHDLDVAHNNDPFFSIPILENVSEASSSSDVIPTIVQTATPNSEHVTKWTKDHPLDNIISELERPISIRLQLYEQALFCYYDAFLT